MTSNIAGVARASEDTGAAASQVLGAATELSRQSEQLAAEMSRFAATGFSVRDHHAAVAGCIVNISRLQFSA